MDSSISGDSLLPRYYAAARPEVVKPQTKAVIMRNLQFIRLQALPALLLILIPAAVFAQTQASEDQKKTDDQASHCTVHVVFVEVVVYDGAGREATALLKDDFKIYENGTRQVIDFFQRRAVSVSEQSSTHYTIGYFPFNEKLDDRARGIKVEVWPKDGVKYFVYFVAPKESEKSDRQ
jgi:hypothetical protein